MPLKFCADHLPLLTWELKNLTLALYRLDAEAKGSMELRILKAHIKSQGRQPEVFMTRLKP